MKPVFLTADFIHADFSAVFLLLFYFPIVSLLWDSLLNIGWMIDYDKMAFHADSVLFFFKGDYGANFFHNFRH